MKLFVRLRCLWLALSFTLILTRSASSQQHDRADVMRGLATVSIEVFASRAFTDAGLDTAGLRTTVELELRRAGVPIVQGAPGAFLWVDIHGMKLTNTGGMHTGFAYVLLFSLRQPLSSPTYPSAINYGQVWETTSTMGGSGPDIMKIQEMLHDDVQSRAETFANDWLRTHTTRPR